MCTIHPRSCLYEIIKIIKISRILNERSCMYASLVGYAMSEHCEYS